uniref:RING-type E3 ubiquitin transferase n=1 Tax=Hanusia phi TaxID=3032 RepID=A0A7S0HZX6_9CRYP|mmetsp:Transcript_716/g.1526  ORF Transcript_716/g.1526 Transcript_716/m.1526 type:complete len:569 (+) Transcript_716:537-2243(+)
MNDFYKGRWYLTNGTDKVNLKHTSGHVVFQIITRAHGREIKRIRPTSSTEKATNSSSMPEQESPAAGKSNLVLGDGIVSQGVVIGSARNESSTSDGAKGAKEVVLVEEVDMIQVDMVIRDGQYSTSRDLHTYMQGLYRKGSGKLQLWTVCNSPECGMYMFGGWKGGSQPPFLGPGFDGSQNRSDTSLNLIQQERQPRPYRPSIGRNQRGKCIFRVSLQTMKRPTFQEDDKPLPPIILYGNITSANCGINMTMNATSMNFEVYYSKAMHYTLMVTAASFMQVLLLVRQIEYSNSRTSAIKVSLLTIGQQAIMDSYLCLMHLTTGIVVEALFNAFATAAFFKFMIFSIFEMRYLLIIWKARRPHGFQEGWNSMRRELSMLYSRFYGCLLAGIVLIYQMQRYTGALVLLIYSFWVPQIVHSIHHDHRKPLLLRYIIGISCTRLLIPLYAFACPYNFLHSEPNYTLAFSLVAWVGFQVAILILQHYKGPRFFIPRIFRPEKYDYYRRIPMESPSESQDCAICMMSVGSSHDTSPRVVTPCDHVFHQDCLKRWMEIKLECPVCRRNVPDIDDD